MRIRMAAYAVALIAGIGVHGSSNAQQAVQVGVLNCDVSAGFGLIITSSKSMRCEYRPSRGPAELYSGTIRRFGLDIGLTKHGIFIWNVFSGNSGLPYGALAGNYVGASASATVAVGFGANALVGGPGQAVTLQPLSVQVQTGLNFAAGVASLELRSGQE